MDPDDAAPRRFFLYFIGSCFLGDNKSEIKLKLVAAVRVVSSIRDFVWGALTYGFFIYGMRCFAQGESNSSLGFWQILSYWAYEYIPSLRPQYQSLSVDAFPRVMVWSTCIITKATLIKLDSIRVALDCYRESDIRHEHYDRAIYC